MEKEKKKHDKERICSRQCGCVMLYSWFHWYGWVTAMTFLYHWRVMRPCEWYVCGRIKISIVCWRCGPQHSCSAQEFYSKTGVQESAARLKCSAHTDAWNYTWCGQSSSHAGPLSLSLLYVCSCLQRRFSATISVLSGLGKRKLEDLNGRRKTILLSLNLFDRNYFITGMKAKDAQRRGACVHPFLMCGCVFRRVALALTSQ